MANEKPSSGALVVVPSPITGKKKRAPITASTFVKLGLSLTKIAGAGAVIFEKYGKYLAINIVKRKRALRWDIHIILDACAASLDAYEKLKDAGEAAEAITIIKHEIGNIFSDPAQIRLLAYIVLGAASVGAGIFGHYIAPYLLAVFAPQLADLLQLYQVLHGVVSLSFTL